MLGIHGWVSYLSFLCFIQEKEIKNKRIDEKKKKKKKRKKRKNLELGMTNMPLRHALLDGTV